MLARKSDHYDIHQNVIAYVLLFVLLMMFVIPFAIWWQHVGDLSVYWHYEMPKGQVLYIASKLAGLIASGLLAFQVCLGFLRCSLLKNNGALMHRCHMVVGIALLVFGVGHVALFVTGVSIRQGYPALSLLMLNFSDYMHTGITLGLLSGVLLLLVAMVGRYQRKAPVYKWVHLSSVLVFIGVIIHSLMIGSEANTYYYQWYYVLLIFMVIISATVRFRYRV